MRKIIALLLISCLFFAALPAQAQTLSIGDFLGACSDYYQYDNENDPVRLYPPQIDYIGYTGGSIPWDYGIGNGIRYTVYMYVSTEDLNDYFAYVVSFGYDEAGSRDQDGYRIYAFTNPGAPSYLPKTFEVHYYASQAALVTVFPYALEEAFEAFEAQRTQEPAMGIGETQALSRDIDITLAGVMLASVSTLNLQSAITENLDRLWALKSPDTKALLLRVDLQNRGKPSRCRI